MNNKLKIQKNPRNINFWHLQSLGASCLETDRATISQLNFKVYPVLNLMTNVYKFQKDWLTITNGITQKPLCLQRGNDANAKYMLLT